MGRSGQSAANRLALMGEKNTQGMRHRGNGGLSRWIPAFAGMTNLFVPPIDRAEGRPPLRQSCANGSCRMMEYRRQLCASATPAKAGIHNRMRESAGPKDLWVARDAYTAAARSPSGARRRAREPRIEEPGYRIAHSDLRRSETEATASGGPMTRRTSPA